MGRKSKDKGLRTPRAPTKAKRGIGTDVDIDIPHPIPPEEAVKKFGPCHVDAQQARTAILVLQSPESHVVLESLNCLQKFCKKRDENKQLFIEMDGLIAARKLIYDENKVIQRFAMKLIAITSTFHIAAIQLRDFDMGKDMIALAGSDDDVVIEYATFTLSSLATLFTGRLQIIQNAGLPLVIHLLSHDDPDVKKNSAETIWRIIEEPLNFDLIISKSSIEPVLKLIHADYPALQIVALSILERVSTRDTGIQVLETINAIPEMGEKLSHPEMGDLHRAVLRTLTNICLKRSSCRQVVPLVGSIANVLDTSPDVPATVYALGLLGQLSVLPIVSKGLVDYGMCPRVTKYIATHEDVGMKEAAVYCMSQLSQSDIRAKRQFIEAIQPIISLIDGLKLSKPGFEYAMLSLASVLEDSNQACPEFINQGGLCSFVKILENSGEYSEDGIISLMTCITLLGSQWNIRSYCIDAGLVPLLLKLLLSNVNPQFLTAATNAICALLCDETGRKQFMDGEGYTLLTKLLSHDEFPVVLSSIPMIHVLGTYPEITKDLIEKGIFQEFWKRQDLISKNGPMRTAFERLLGTHLPAKYSIAGHIEPFEKLSHGFYDCGSMNNTTCFLTMNQMTWETRDPQRKVLYLNWDSVVDDQEALKNNKSLQAMQSEGQNLQTLMDSIKEDMPKVENEKALVRAIAKAVSERLGGVLDKWRVSSHAEDLEIANLQVKHKSIVIPITMISTGAFRSRAIIFKALCDIFGIPCSLERGDYQRMWNVVLLQSKKTPKLECPCEESEEVAKSLFYTEKLRRFVVDLVHQPGALMSVNSYEANAYCFV